MSMHLMLKIHTAILAAALFITLQAQTTYDGYTFVFNGKKAYLYGMDKKVIHEWTSAYTVAGCADLLRDSSVLFPSGDNGSWTKGGILTGGRLQIIQWDGTVTWDYLYRSADYMPHHDIEPVYYTNDPAEKPNVLVICYTAWGDKITELKPTGLNTATVVWEWVASDHTCAAGTGTDKPEFLDKGKGGVGTMGGDVDRMHSNNVSFNRTQNQLVISVKGYNEMMVIDHSTTTAEAKGRTGGRYGKGGDILYRWGNPANYLASGTRYLSGQHAACWVPDTFLGTNLPVPGAFNLICVDNGNKRIVEITPAGTKNGVYPRTAGTAFAPASPLWTYGVSSMQGNEGSVQRLPNGNVIICTGGVSMGGGSSTGRVFEATSEGTVVWDLTGIPQSTEGVRYAYSYLGGQSTGIKTQPVSSAKGLLRIVTNPKSGLVRVCAAGDVQDAHLSLFSLHGRKLFDAGTVRGGEGWTLGRLPAGIYFVKIAGSGMEQQRLFQLKIY